MKKSMPENPGLSTQHSVPSPGSPVSGFRQTGFTLIELVVVITLVAVLGATLLNRVTFYQERAEQARRSELQHRDRETEEKTRRPQSRPRLRITSVRREPLLISVMLPSTLAARSRIVVRKLRSPGIVNGTPSLAPINVSSIARMPTFCGIDP